ncbi:MAG: hypothetical protein CMM15_07400 [Rhodospirillaceae bacterium]|nr:hypothetical protein [Rhodospirillaceae bacterium]
MAKVALTRLFKRNRVFTFFNDAANESASFQRGEISLLGVKRILSRMNCDDVSKQTASPPDERDILYFRVQNTMKTILKVTEINTVRIMKRERFIFRYPFQCGKS